jgi:hypothetical protein
LKTLESKKSARSTSLVPGRIVTEDGETYTWNGSQYVNKNGYVYAEDLQKRGGYVPGSLTGAIDAIKEGRLDSARRTLEPRLEKAQRKAMKKAAKAAKRIAKQQRAETAKTVQLTSMSDREASLATIAMLIKSAASNDLTAQRELRKRAVGNLPESLRVEIAKAAYDSIGLGNKPVQNPRYAEADNRPALPSSGVGMRVLGDVGIKPMPAVTNTTVGDRHDPRALSPQQMQKLVRDAEGDNVLLQRLHDPRLSSASMVLEEIYSQHRIQLDPLTMRPILTADLADKLTSSGGGSADDGKR